MKFSLNLKWVDLGKGLLLAVLASAIAIIKVSVDAGSLQFDWHAIGLASSATAVAYLLKNLFSQGTMVQSAYLRLNFRDLVNGFVVSVGGAVLTLIETSIQAGQFHFDWKAIGLVAISAAIAYLTKNFFSQKNPPSSPQPPTS